MKQRVISAFFGIIILVLVLLGNQTVFDVVIALISAVAIYEVLNAIGLSKNKVMTAISVFFPIPLMFFSYFATEYISALIFLFITIFMIMMLFSKGKYNFNDTALYIAVPVIFALSFLYVSLIRRLGNDILDIFVLLIGCWITDTCAYFAGDFFGTHKLAPQISPKKTIEGSIIGTVMGTVVGSVYYYNLVNGVTLFETVMLCLFLTVLSEIGDLFFSSIKRYFDQKDYSNLLPGHGGILDRFDSVIYVSLGLSLILSFM